MPFTGVDVLPLPSGQLSVRYSCDVGSCFGILSVSEVQNRVTEPGRYYCQELYHAPHSTLKMFSRDIVGEVGTLRELVRDSYLSIQQEDIQLSMFNEEAT
jgi:hypothetical protein